MKLTTSFFPSFIVICSKITWTSLISLSTLQVNTALLPSNEVREQIIEAPSGSDRGIVNWILCFISLDIVPLIIISSPWTLISSISNVGGILSSPLFSSFE